jgi:hypothetical protein
MATMKSALQAKEKIKGMLSGLPGINGIGISWDNSGEPCVRVNVDNEIDQASRSKIPSLIEGVPVMIEETEPAQLE